MTSDVDTCGDFGPSLKYHIIQNHLPTIYKYFLGFSALCLIIVAMILIPHLRKLKIEGILRREAKNAVLVSSGYKLILYLCALPLVVCLTKFLSLLSPISLYTQLFISGCYLAFCIVFCFRLLLLYLGTINSAVDSLQAGEPTKFWAVPPCGCCCKCCIQPRHPNSTDLRLIHALIVQYAILEPIFSFWLLFGNATSNDLSLSVLGVISAVSTMTSVYGFQSLLTVSGQVLSHISIEGKFRTVQFTMVSMRISALVFKFVPISAIDDIYDKTVMAGAYQSMTDSVLMIIFALMFRRYYNVNDAELACKSLEKGALIANSDTSSVQGTALLETDADTVSML